MINTASAPLVLAEIDTGLPQSGQWRDGFDLADMNGDGHLDVLHGSPRKGPFVPMIFLGDGHGRFARWREAHFPPLPYDYGDIKAGDVNGDGLMDIALSSHLRGLAVLISEGNGHYAPWGEGLVLRPPGQFPDEETFASRAIALTDWNGDGALDLLALNEGPSRFVTAPLASDALAIYLNRGGVWQRVHSAQRLSGFGSDLAVGDVDGDGRKDALAGSMVTGVRRLLHRSGKDSPETVDDLPWLPARAITTAVALADLDPARGDELLAATLTVQAGIACSALDSAGAHKGGTLLWSAAERVAITSIATGDVDGDGDRDVMALRDDGALMTFTMNGGALQRDATVRFPERYTGCTGYDVQIADLDGDGRGEVLASYAGEGATMAGAICPAGGGFAVWRVNSQP